eukprot:424196_1
MNWMNFVKHMKLYNSKKKLSIRKLYNIINKTRTITNDKKDEKKQHDFADAALKEFLIKNNISVDIYHIFASQEIGYKQLATITPYDIDKLCEQNNVKIGSKIKLKTIIDQHQMRLIQHLDKEIEETKKGPDVVHLCICGAPLVKVKDGSSLYNSGVLCDKCSKSAKKGETFWHCKKGKISDHTLGFDICNNCINKYKFIPAKKKINVDEMKADIKMKIVLAGDAAVGKSSLITRYVEDTFNDFLPSTIGIGLFLKRQLLSGNKVAELRIWDTAGQETFNSPLTAGHYRDADAILLCYGCDNARTLANCEKTWKQQIEQNAKDDVIILIIGCKSDQKHNRQLSEFEGRTLINKPHWKKYNAWWGECSAKTGHNISNIFATAAEMVVKQRDAFATSDHYTKPRQFQNSRVNVNAAHQVPKDKTKCCK